MAEDNHGMNGVGMDNLDTLSLSTRTSKRKGSEWEILGNLEKGVHYTIKPKRYEEFLLKRRKWPLKGWHKRYFVMEQGVLTYGKSKADIARGRTLGKFNIGEAVISANYVDMRVDIDADESVHHIKSDNMEEFGLFLEQLQQHRLFTQHINNNGQILDEGLGASCSSPGLPGVPGTMSLTRGASIGGAGRGSRSSLISEFSQLDESISAHMEHMDKQLYSLVDMIQRLEDLETLNPQRRKGLFPQIRKKKSASASNSSTLTNSSGTSGRSCHSASSTSTISTVVKSDRSSPVPSSVSSQDTEEDCLVGSPLSGSNPSLNSVSSMYGGAARARPVSTDAQFPRTQSRMVESCSKEDVVQLANNIQTDLTSMKDRYRKQRDHIRQLLDSETKSNSLQPQFTLISSLRQSLNMCLQQNSSLRSKLARIHAESEISDLPVLAAPQEATLTRGINGSLSFSSSCMSEFFDAREYNDTDEDTDDDISDDDICDTNESGTEEDDNIYQEADSSICTETEINVSESTLEMESLSTGRRRTLPVPKTDTEGVNLWNLLRKNIGKDLSKISMPVTLNEPLSTLQRLCEELEYAELLEKAVKSETVLERIQWVIAFSISCYGSYNSRASHKPFNPLLGETFECVRDDKGFRFISEQVSHHPPISAAHANGTGWEWFQCLRIRSKFWGRSMEFQPEGKVEVTLKLDNGQQETYVWNKVTSCIHNLLGAERWVDLYGESEMKCRETGLTARIQFVKASYWSTKRSELLGTILDSDGSVLQNLFGKWNEALYVGKAPSAKCIWRPGALPEDSQIYYGFSRFAIELNELMPSEAERLPPTDVRWRPDQRALEDGKIGEAESIKLGVEQAQRDRRKQRETGQITLPFKALWFSESREEDDLSEDESKPERWIYNDCYWSKKSQGFQGIEFEPLW